MKPTPYRGNDPFIFVSYAHDDSAQIYAEIDSLTSAGFNVFYDEGISPGHSWHEDLANALEACQLFVFFVTPRSAASKNCLREVHFAEELDKPCLIVNLQETELTSGLKLSIGDQQAINAFELEPDAYRARLCEAAAEVVQPIESESSVAPAPVRVWRTQWTLALIATLVISVVGLFIWRTYQAGLAADYALLVEAEAFVQQDRYGEAFLIARELKLLPLVGEERFQELWDAVVVPISPQVSAAGAAVFMRSFDVKDTPWIELGQTPLQEVDAPRGVLQLRVQKPGFDAANFVVANPGPMLGNQGETYSTGQFPLLELNASGTLSAEMIRVPATFIAANLQGSLQLTYGGPPRKVPAFSIGRIEVTNEQFDEFVRDGGYADASLWLDLPLEEGGNITMQQVQEWFVDTTGRNAPAHWELGTYPTGAQNLPVGGISWYEANAYARHRGLQLPTAHHWSRAAQGPLDAQFATAPNLSSAGNYGRDGSRSASDRAMGPWGTLDMAGNVREWVWNATSQGRLALGGSWLDYPWIYQSAYSLNALDRSPQNGVRLMDASLDELNSADIADPIGLIVDLPAAIRESVSDATFEGMRYQFTHAASKVTEESVVIAQDFGDFVVEEVSLEYDSGEILILYVGRPKRTDKALQSLIYMSTAGSFRDAPNNTALWHFQNEIAFLVRTGRAVVVPIWAGSLGRFEAFSEVEATRLDQERRRAINWYQDAARTIDYLETRQDFAADQVAYIGFSHGAIFGPLVVAVEDRFKAALLISGGVLSLFNTHPMYDIVNYLPRITQPVLYITGRFDPIFPYEASQIRYFDLLGAPLQDKTHLLFDNLGHFDFPRNRFNTAVVDWLDQQFGPAR